MSDLRRSRFKSVMDVAKVNIALLLYYIDV